MSYAGRNRRLHRGDRPDDQREPGQRDRDRILYTSAFRRLNGVTQVVAAAEGHIFHNRLTHTLEVAQIGQRLAEKLLKEPDGKGLVEAVGGIDPEVVEAAALAHDLGHPPFGHIAEEVLNQLVQAEDVLDGFEGNAQSFRVVTKLAFRHRRFPGLNLTRATLNAILKYPWLRQTGGGLKQRKYGAYHTEEREFEWARELFPGDDRRSAESELMDWADDIAYAVHDVEDFYRAGLVPLDRLASDRDEAARFCEEVFKRWRRERRKSPYNEGDLKQAFVELVGDIFPFTEAYLGTRRQRAALRSLTAGLIGRYISAIQLQVPTAKLEPRVRIEAWAKKEITMLKELTWQYVINDPALATQQYGQRHVIGQLFEIFKKAATSKEWAIFPPGFREQLERAQRRAKSEEERKHQTIRVVVDLIAGMTEQQALEMYQRLTGISFGSVLNVIVR